MAMREGMGNDGFVINDVEECAGLHLRADYCAEHEWGIKPMRKRFGVDTEQMGIEKRRISNSGNVYLVEFTKKKEKCAFLTNYLTDESNTFGRTQGTWNDLEQYINEYRWFNLERNEQNEGVAGAWDESDFVMVVKGQENIKLLKEVYEAFQTNDIAIFLGGGHGPFSNAGLSISIISQLPAELIQDMYNIDMSSQWLKQAAEKTGIENKLDKAGLKYHALKPEWNDPENHSEGVKFWLNPYNQVANNHGWYSVEELEQWIAGEGPIPKVPSVVTKSGNIQKEWTDENGNIII